MPFPRCQPKQKKVQTKEPPINFWMTETGDNMLKGCCGDEENPIKLGDCFIVDALQRNPRARTDFCLLYPTLSECEKERFDILMRDNPLLFKMITDCQSLTDKFQSALNKTPIYTAGRQGGRRLPIGCAPLPVHLRTKGCC